MRLASIGGWSVPVPDWVYYPAVVVVALVVTYVIARVAARYVGDKLRERHMRSDVVVITRRVVTALVIVVGIFLALGWAAQNSNVTLFGLLLATVVAALGVQQLARAAQMGSCRAERNAVFGFGNRRQIEVHPSTLLEQVPNQVVLM